jgi:hypothetical protein
VLTNNLVISSAKVKRELQAALRTTELYHRGKDEISLDESRAHCDLSAVRLSAPGVSGSGQIAAFSQFPLCLPSHCVYEVEFSDDNGIAYAMVALKAEQSMRLHHQPTHQAA